MTNAEKAHRHRILHPLGPMLARARQRAKRDNVPFDISANDIVLPTHCPILLIELDYGRDKVGNNSPSLDKVIPALGYVKGNVRVISNRANQKKSDWTVDELRRLAMYMGLTIF